VFFRYLRSDKGYGRVLSIPMTKRPENPKSLNGPSEYVNLTEAMMNRGRNENHISKVPGENWPGFLGGVERIGPFSHPPASR